MRTIKHLLLAGLAAGALVVTGCGLRGGSGPRPSVGSLSAPEAPPAPRDPHFEDKPGHVWVHGRWAWMDSQWQWQPGYHEPERPGQVYVNGYWDRRQGTFVWIKGDWKPARPGFVYVPGYWGYRGSNYVWIRDTWEPEKAGHTWVAGKWVKQEGGDPQWVEGHWEDSATAKAPKKK